MASKAKKRYLETGLVMRNGHLVGKAEYEFETLAVRAKRVSKGYQLLQDMLKKGLGHPLALLSFRAKLEQEEVYVTSVANHRSLSDEQAEKLKELLKSAASEKEKALQLIEQKHGNSTPT